MAMGLMTIFLCDPLLNFGAPFVQPLVTRTSIRDYPSPINLPVSHLRLQ